MVDIQSPPRPPQMPGMEPGDLAFDFHRHLAITLGRDRYNIDDYYRYQALAMTVRDRLMARWKQTHVAYYEADCRRGYYLSMEYLLGRSLGNALLNLGIDGETREALSEFGYHLEDLAEQEADAGLGNGGLGRLAACFLDSCATLQLPVTGYGIRYEYGMFRQEIENGYQIEEPDHWLAAGNVWELCRPEYTRTVHFGGQSQPYRDSDGAWRIAWIDTHDVLAVPYDVPVPGYRNRTVNTLRLWRSEATQEFDLDEFNQGDYALAVREKNSAENISMVLYPNDKSENGKELRLRQQYFLASASLQDVLRRWSLHHDGDFAGFAEKNVFQLNDTHPTVAVAELMRLLMDERGLGWEEAWDLTTRTMAYTNHTLLPEALEKWSTELFAQLLPRPYEIICEINARFLREVARRWPGDRRRIARMSIIEEGEHPQVRMAYLAIVASFSVNGVAELHSHLLRGGLFRDFAELWPGKFNNKTNGVTQRRWLASCNPGLAGLLDETVGPDWQVDLGRLEGLREHLGDGEFRERWRAVKRANKERLAKLVASETGVHFDPAAIFDVQVKRIHEYKRQLLNLFHLIHCYDRIKRGDLDGWTPRCTLIGGKAAPGYAIAKRIVKLAGNIAETIDEDPDCDGLLSAAFLPNFRVSNMEIVCPGTDLSEQISTAGKEASGTGNMKFMMNGALTIGTLDGANIEIRDEVGEEWFFLFGLTAEEVERRRADHDPAAAIAADPDLARVVELLESGHFNQVEPGIFDDLVRSVRDWGDYWMIAADFRDYVDTQRRAAERFRDRDWWTEASIRNVAASGKFSTDRTMREYNDDIWHLEPVPPREEPPATCAGAARR